MNIEENAIYTYKDLEQMLGISQRTLGEMVKNGRLHFISLGNKNRFLGSALLKDLKDLMFKYPFKA